jgi:hypothetical protein
MADTSIPTIKDEIGLQLLGDETEDEKIVCQWFATSYGETNREYHEAYSREILRQMREQLKSDSKAKNSWFG